MPHVARFLFGFCQRRLGRRLEPVVPFVNGFLARHITDMESAEKNGTKKTKFFWHVLDRGLTIAHRACVYFSFRHDASPVFSQAIIVFEFQSNSYTWKIGGMSLACPGCHLMSDD